MVSEKFCTCTGSKRPIGKGFCMQLKEVESKFHAGELKSQPERKMDM